MVSSQTGHAWTARRLPKDQIQALHALRGARDNTEMESFNRRFTSWELEANTGHAPVPPNCNLVALAQERAPGRSVGGAMTLPSALTS